MHVSVLEMLIFLATIWLAVILGKIKFWIRYPLAVLLLCAGFGILAMSFLPLFEEAPDIQKFIDNETTTIHIFSQAEDDSNSEITIYNNSQKQKLLWYQNQFAEVVLDKNYSITYAASDATEKSFAFVEFPYGAYIVLLPQSQISVGQLIIDNTKKLTVDVKQGSIYTFPSSLTDMTADIFVAQWSGFVVAMTGQLTTINDELVIMTGIENIPHEVFYKHQHLTQKYLERRNSFFVEEAGWTHLNNPTVQNILELYLNTLFSLDPGRFGNNVINFDAYQKYFSQPAEHDYESDFVDANIDRAVKSRTKGAWERTKLFEWVKKIEKYSK